ncbi:hypothetical protein Agub_g2569, partial [Astrephomene gubernaculifera]
ASLPPRLTPCAHQELLLDANQLGDAALRELAAAALPRMQQLQILHLQQNPSLGPDGAASLSSALPHLTALQQLDLSHSHTGDSGVRHLAKALSALPSLAHLSLDSCKIGAEGATHLAAALGPPPFPQHSAPHPSQQQHPRKQPPPPSAHIPYQPPPPRLTRLDLAGNQLGDRGVAALAEALGRNAVLACLDLRRNAVGLVGCRRLEEVLTRRNASLRVLALAGNEMEPADLKKLEALAASERIPPPQQRPYSAAAPSSPYLTSAAAASFPASNHRARGASAQEDTQTHPAGPLGAQSQAQQLRRSTPPTAAAAPAAATGGMFGVSGGGGGGGGVALMRSQGSSSGGGSGGGGGGGGREAVTKVTAAAIAQRMAADGLVAAPSASALAARQRQLTGRQGPSAGGSGSGSSGGGGVAAALDKRLPRNIRSSSMPFLLEDQPSLPFASSTSTPLPRAAAAAAAGSAAAFAAPGAGAAYAPRASVGGGLDMGGGFGSLVVGEGGGALGGPYTVGSYTGVIGGDGDEDLEALLSRYRSRTAAEVELGV